MSQLPITVLPGLVAYIHRENVATIRHIGTSPSSKELFRIIGAPKASSDQLQLFKLDEKAKQELIISVVECAEDRNRTAPLRLDAQEYVDFLRPSEIYEPRQYNEDDGEWKTIEGIGWFVRIITKV